VDAVLAGLGSAELVRRNRIRVTVPSAHVLEAIERARTRLACDHLVQIATVDTGASFELHYHLTGPHTSVVSIRTVLPRDAPRIASAHRILPAAALYERQIHDLFGIVFEGHPDPRRIILNEDWPEGEYPLRKDWKMDPARSYGGVPEEE
jgi:NADH-quinone oxidoreductase subunit C